ncbi:MAG: nucleotidyltransferase family protein [Methylocystaceae bacterium]|nr:nucleotidyltransferase family protein [Methylocystaceae bacterium]
MSHPITSGMILAAGLGTRMRPLTNTTPKPLIKVAGRTMADRAIDLLKHNGVENVVLNASYLGEQIKDHFAKRTDIQIDISEESQPLETGGGVTKALPLLKGDAFFVLNGDAVLLNGHTPALERMARKWQHEDLDILLLLHPSNKAIGYDGRGDFTLTSNGTPAFRTEQRDAPYVFTGVQIIARHTFEGRTVTKWSLREIYQNAIEKGRAKAIVHDGDWLHVGTPHGLELAEDHFAKFA